MSVCSFVTKMAHHIKVKAGQQQSSSSSTSSATPDDDNDDDDDEESLIAQLCPQFVWPVRDFTLQLDLDGKQATPDEYLERCLQEKPGKAAKHRTTVHTFADRSRALYFAAMHGL